MSKKPLVRSKKRAVHTNTKDKLSKLIAEVDSIAKELSKVKKGGLGDMSKMTGGDSIFSKIVGILNKQKTNITILKLEYIDLLIDGHIMSLNNNYTSVYRTNSFQISGEIKYIIDKLPSSMYEYDIDYDIDKVNQIDKSEKNLENIDKMRKITHILNIFKYLYNEVKDQPGINSSNNIDEVKITHFTNSKINQILFNNSSNDKDYRYTFMDELKKTLMDNVFKFVLAITDSNPLQNLRDKIRVIYSSIQNKYIFSYKDLMDSSYNFNDFNNLGKIDEMNIDINSLKRIKFKYDIYTNFICSKPDYNKNLFIHTLNDNIKYTLFSFNSIYNILGDIKITSIKVLKEQIKLVKIIEKDEGDRSPNKSMFRQMFNFNRDDTRQIDTIISSLKKNFDNFNEKNKNLKKGSIKIREDAEIKDKDKDKQIQNLQKTIDDFDKKITKDINAFNLIKEGLITKYKKEHATVNLTKIYEDINKYFVQRLNDAKINEEDIKRFKLDVNSTASPLSEGGKLVTKYKSTGESVYILYKRKKIKRCVYVKAKGRGKYCKVNGEYKLLSKLKIM